jgi:hypothetical protein
MVSPKFSYLLLGYINLIFLLQDSQVNPWASSIFPPKSKESSKLSIGHFRSLTLGHPMKFSCVPMLLKAYSDIELSNYFIIPIFLES